MDCCELCGKGEHEIVLVGMEPGRDGKQWWLCLRCYVDGLFPGKLGRIPAKYREAAERDAREAAAAKARKTSSRRKTG